VNNRSIWDDRLREGNLVLSRINRISIAP